MCKTYIAHWICSSLTLWFECSKKQYTDMASFWLILWPCMFLQVIMRKSFPNCLQPLLFVGTQEPRRMKAVKDTHHYQMVAMNIHCCLLLVYLSSSFIIAQLFLLRIKVCAGLGTTAVQANRHHI